MWPYGKTLFYRPRYPNPPTKDLHASRLLALDSTHIMYIGWLIIYLKEQTIQMPKEKEHLAQIKIRKRKKKTSAHRLYTRTSEYGHEVIN